MRFEATATCLSWIPPTAVEGAFGLPFGIGVAHYDAPPPDVAPDIDTLLAADAIRFANQIHAWIEVDDGRITSHGRSGGGGGIHHGPARSARVDLRRRRPGRPYDLVRD